MTLESDIVERINSGKLSPEILDCIVLDYLEKFRKQIKQKFYRKKAGNDGKKFMEYIMIENVRALYQSPPVLFYVLLKNHNTLRDLMNLTYLDTYKKYKDFDRKRKLLKKNIKDTIKRNFKKKVDEMYILDTTIGETDLNRIRNGKLIKEGTYDAEFVHSSTKGTVVGFTVCTLVNWSNLSVEKVEFYPKNTSKKQMWKEMVIDTLGTKTGKIKIVLADAGFFAYQNYLFSIHYRLIPVIKPRSDLRDKLLKKIKELPVSLLWYDQRYNKMFKTLLEEFHEIISLTTSYIKKYDDFKEKRGEIELIFKIAKKIFGMEDLHIYYTEQAYWNVYIYLYLSSLFHQYLTLQGINPKCAVELFQQDHGLT
jgi:hypothetical protein